MLKKKFLNSDLQKKIGIKDKGACILMLKDYRVY